MFIRLFLLLAALAGCAPQGTEGDVSDVTLPFTISPASANEPNVVDAELIEIVRTFNPLDNTVHVDRFIQLIEEAGGNPDAKDAGGSSLLHLAIGTFGRATVTPPVREGMRQIIAYLLARGVDPNAKNTADITGLMLAVAENPAVTGPLVDTLLALGADPNAPSTSPSHVYVPAVLRAASGDARREFLFKFVAANADLTERDGTGRNIFHFATSTFGARADGTPIFTWLYSLVGAQTGKPMLVEHDKSDFPPAFYAARAGNMVALRLILEETGRASLRHISREGVTALGLARSTGRTEAIAFLQSLGAPEPRVPGSPDITCDAGNSMPFTYEKLVQVIETCGIRSIDDLLGLLPIEFRTHYAVAFATKARQAATPSHPQVVMYSRDGKLMLSFNGDPALQGFNHLEIIQFRDATKEFELRDIRFPETGPGQVEFSGRNPQSCLGCHGVQPRILWDNFILWPGKFGGEVGQMYAPEQAMHRRFEANRSGPRYRHLLDLSTDPIVSEFGGNSGLDNLTNVDALAEHLIGQMVARRTKENIALRPYRYAIMAAASCNDDIRSYLPPAVRARLDAVATFESLLADTRQKASSEYIDRVNTLRSFLGGGPFERFGATQLVATLAGRITGQSTQTERAARLRYMLENQGVSMQSWFTHFADNTTRYVSLSMDNHEFYLSKEFLDPGLEQDAALLGMFRKEAERIRAAFPGNFPFIFKTPASRAVYCPLLKANSLAELGEGT